MFVDDFLWCTRVATPNNCLCVTTMAIYELHSNCYCLLKQTTIANLLLPTPAHSLIIAAYHSQ